MRLDRTSTTPISRWWWTVDRWMLAALAALIFCGVILVLAASPAVSLRIGLDRFYLARHHAAFLPLALAIVLAVSLLDLRNLRRLDYALEKFGFTKAQRGVTAHGLRHGNLQGFYESLTGVPAPVRGGGPLPADLDRQARLAVSERAGHSRVRAAGAYLGQSVVMGSKGRKAP